jgi:hypothetical protein
VYKIQAKRHLFSQKEDWMSCRVMMGATDWNNLLKIFLGHVYGEESGNRQHQV